MKEELKNKTKKFAIDVFTNSQLLEGKFNDYKHQLIRCSSSVGANYRAACRAKSSKDFINKLKIVEEELDESLFFIEIIKDLTFNSNKEWEKIYNEGNILLAIIVKSILTTRKNLKTNSSTNVIRKT
ncbi:MAG TPA: four helix bundle protein [Bacteroidales bacterium]